MTASTWKTAARPRSACDSAVQTEAADPRTPLAGRDASTPARLRQRHPPGLMRTRSGLGGRRRLVVRVGGAVPRSLTPEPACACLDQVSSSAITAGCLSTQSTTRSPGLARDIACRTRLDLVEHHLDLLAAGALGHRGAHPLGHQRRRVCRACGRAAPRPRGPRPRRSAGPRSQPSSRMSSSRRSPAVAMTPIRDGRAELAGGRQALADPVHEVAEHPHAGRVVAVVDDHLHAVDLDLVEPAGGEVVVRRERPQPLPDVVQRGAGGERGRGGARARSARSSGPGRRTSPAAGGSRPAASRGGRA